MPHSVIIVVRWRWAPEWLKNGELFKKTKLHCKGIFFLTINESPDCSLSFSNVQIFCSCRLTGLYLVGLWLEWLQKILPGISKRFEVGSRLWKSRRLWQLRGHKALEARGVWVAGDIQSRSRQTHWRFLHLVYHFSHLFTSDMSWSHVHGNSLRHHCLRTKSQSHQGQVGRWHMRTLPPSRF